MRFRNPFLFIAIAGSLLALGACQKGVIQADAIDAPMTGVLTRHDTYVNADASLSEVQKSTYLRSSALIRAALNEALQKNKAPAPATKPVAKMETDLWSEPGQHAPLEFADN